jgi:hypothetical protein
VGEGRGVIKKQCALVIKVRIIPGFQSTNTNHPDCKEDRWGTNEHFLGCWTTKFSSYPPVLGRFRWLVGEDLKTKCEMLVSVAAHKEKTMEPN